MKQMIKKHLLKIKPYKPGKPIEEVKRELRLKRAIKLASNENALGPSPAVIRGITKTLKSLNRYPDGGCFYLKKALSKKFRLDPANFIIGNGSDEVIVFAIRAFVKPGEEVIIARPTFLIYEIASKVEGVKIKYAPLKNYRYDLKAIKKAVTKKTKIIFIANPDNPTGSYVTKKEVNSFLSGLRKDVIVFFDEAYYEFAAPKSNYPRTSGLLKKRNVIITRSFSKIYSLAGVRIGYGMANKDLISGMEKVREPFNVNSVAQAAAIAALSDGNHAKKTLKLTNAGKQYIYRELDSLDIEYVPSATNFVLINIGKKALRVYNALLRKGIIVRYMGAWKLDSFIRVTIGTMSENKEFILTLRKILVNEKFKIKNSKPKFKI